MSDETTTPLTDRLPYNHQHPCGGFYVPQYAVREQVELPLRAEIAKLKEERDKYLAELRRCREAMQVWEETFSWTRQSSDAVVVRMLNINKEPKW